MYHNSPALFYVSPRPGYLPGEEVQGDVQPIQRGPVVKARFLVKAVVGSGFAGQVYRAETAPGAPVNWPKQVALKILRPRSRWKQAVRDGLFWLCFQSVFAARVDEAAVRAGLLWQALIREAARVHFGENVVARPLGYFWDARLASYVEVHEWIKSRPARYETDAGLVARLLGRISTAANTEMAHKHRFMDGMVELCHAIGAYGLARQYAWYTLVAQANVLTRLDTGAFCVIDCRPGLAFPFFLPFTFIHLRMALVGLREGRLVHYDEVDFQRLDAYLRENPALADRIGGLVGLLRQVDAAYRARLPDLWHTGTLIFTDRAFQDRQAAAALERWVRLNLVTPDTAAWLLDHRRVHALLIFLAGFPLIGGRLVCIAGHSGYRAHLRGLLTSNAYRRVWLAETRVRDIPEWLAFARISQPHAARLAASMPLYVLEKVTLARLPGAAQRWLTDAQARASWAQRAFAQPVRLLTSQAARVAWLDGIIMLELERGLIQAGRADTLQRQIREPRMQQIVRDLGVTAGLDVVARFTYLALGFYGLSTGDLLPLGIAALGPIPPSGVLRELYVLARLAVDLADRLVHQQRLPDRRQMLARLGQVAIAPWRWLGNLFALIEISAYYPRMALLLAEHFASRAVRNVPVFGGQGKLLEYWTFQLIYNIPVGIKALFSRFAE